MEEPDSNSSENPEPPSENNAGEPSAEPATPNEPPSTENVKQSSADTSTLPEGGDPMLIDSEMPAPPTDELGENVPPPESQEAGNENDRDGPAAEDERDGPAAEEPSSPSADTHEGDSLAPPNEEIENPDHTQSEETSPREPFEHTEDKQSVDTDAEMQEELAPVKEEQAPVEEEQTSVEEEQAPEEEELAPIKEEEDQLLVEEVTAVKDEPAPEEEHLANEKEEHTIVEEESVSKKEEQALGEEVKPIKEEESPMQEETSPEQRELRSSAASSKELKPAPSARAGTPSRGDLPKMASSHSAAGDGAKRSGTPRASAGVIARSYEDQIRTGMLNRLTSVITDKDGMPRLVQPGAVPKMNTVNISLAGKRPMSSEKCRRSKSHNCFEGPAIKGGKVPTGTKSHGQYPELMKLSKKMNEFVAASMIEKLRLKGLAAPLNVYRGRKLPFSIMSEMILKPKKKKVTDRYYFGYVPPPNRPRFDQAFKQYLQQFGDRHRPPDDELSYCHALQVVRLLSEKTDTSLPLPVTLAEVIRSQEEPGFGTGQLRRPRSAAF